jgi:hypothetical protein
MKRLFAFSVLLAVAAPAMADPATLPVLDGAATKVLSVRVTSSDAGIPNETVLATVEYTAGCVGTASLVVVPNGDQWGYTVFEARTRPEPGTVPCGAIMRIAQEIKVATFYEVIPNPALIKVNGVSVTPTP